MYSWNAAWTPKFSVHLEQQCMYCTKYILKIPFNKFPRGWIKYTTKSCYDDPLTFRFLSCKDIIPVAFQMLLDDTIWAALNPFVSPLLRLCLTEISSCSFWSVLGWIFVADSFTFYEFQKMKERMSILSGKWRKWINGTPNIKSWKNIHFSQFSTTAVPHRVWGCWANIVTWFLDAESVHFFLCFQKEIGILISYKININIDLLHDWCITKE